MHATLVAGRLTAKDLELPFGADYVTSRPFPLLLSAQDIAKIASSLFEWPLVTVRN
jgi:hypothetical protein